MAGTPVFFATSQFGVTANVTNYAETQTGGSGGTATESVRQFVWQNAGAVTGLYYNVNTSPETSTATVNWRWNGSNGNGTISITAGQLNEITDNTHTDTVSQGGLQCMQQIGGTGSGTINGLTFGYLFTPTSTTTVVTQCCDGPNNYGSANTFYSASSGQVQNASGSVVVTTETSAQCMSQAVAVLQNFSANIAIWQAGTSTGTLNTRVGAGNGNQSLTITAIGQYADTSHTDALVAGSLFNFDAVITTLGSGAGHTMTDVDYVTSTKQVMYMAADAPGVAFSLNTTLYVPIVGRLRNSATETQASCQTGTSFAASEYQSYVSANTISSNTTISFRLGAASGNQSVTFGSGILGWRTDTTHVDNVNPTTEINNRIAVPNAGTAITITNISFLASFTGTESYAYYPGSSRILASSPNRRGRRRLSGNGPLASQLFPVAVVQMAVFPFSSLRAYDQSGSRKKLMWAQ